MLARIGDTPLSEIPSLAAWRRVFAAFGAQPTKYRNAAARVADFIERHAARPIPGPEKAPEGP